ncbi:MAG TPA: TrmH family RNA methyltransferase [Rhodanobacter sp.]|nr:TrmH family RNA methyltransferase [Rhodanobacter sp.]
MPVQNLQLDHSHHQPSQRLFPLRLLAHDIEMPANVGSLFRIADALGVEEIHLTGSSVSPPNRKLNKTSRSTEARVRHSYARDPVVVLRELKAAGYRIVSLEITRSSIDIREFVVAASDRICLVLGSERTGVDQALLELSDDVVHIPMQGGNSSMNVAMACAIATFEITGRFD